MLINLSQITNLTNMAWERRHDILSDEEWGDVVFNYITIDLGNDTILQQPIFFRELLLALEQDGDIILVITRQIIIVIFSIGHILTLLGAWFAYKLYRVRGILLTMQGSTILD